MMQSLTELYRVGPGPSSSHTMGPRRAAELFEARCPSAAAFRVTLFGSLAATGKGHLTDQAIASALAPAAVELVWRPEERLPAHPNGMRFEALDRSGQVLTTWEVCSVGGGALQGEGIDGTAREVYPHGALSEILQECDRTGQSLWEHVAACEGDGIWSFLAGIWRAMEETIDRGLHAEGVLPGGLGVPRKAWTFHRKVNLAGVRGRSFPRLAAYALAVSEENASGGVVVTAPTCGACGVLPAVLRQLYDTVERDEKAVLRALATAGLIGNLVKHNASISGAEVGCQGEVGVACAMAAAAVTQLMGGTPRQVEYAAEMGLEHHLGMTCDPVAGLVQIPCIERNVFAAARAMTCAEYAIFSDGGHRISFDQVVAVMRDTGRDLLPQYRETALGGLARAYHARLTAGDMASAAVPAATAPEP